MYVCGPNRYPFLLPRRGATMARNQSCPAVYHLLFHFWPLGIKMRLFRFRNVTQLIWKIHSCSSAVTSNLDTFIVVVFQPTVEEHSRDLFTSRFKVGPTTSGSNSFYIGIGRKKHLWALDSSSCWQDKLWTVSLSHKLVFTLTLAHLAHTAPHRIHSNNSINLSELTFYRIVEFCVKKSRGVCLLAYISYVVVIMHPYLKTYFWTLLTFTQSKMVNKHNITW